MGEFDAFLHLEGIKGESKDKKFIECLQLESFSWGLINAGAHLGAGNTAQSKVSFQDFHFSMRGSTASPQLAHFCSTGRGIPSAVLTLRKSGGTMLEYATIKMANVLITGFQSGGSTSGNAITLDQVSLCFTKIYYDYKEQRSDGGGSAPVIMEYDLRGAGKPAK